MITHFKHTEIPSILSIILPSKFREGFNTYGDALYNYLEYKEIEKVWLAEKITKPGQKIESSQQKLSDWKKEGRKPNRSTRNLIDKILGISISRNTSGKWTIEEVSNAQNTISTNQETSTSLSKDEIKILDSKFDLLLKVIKDFNVIKHDNQNPIMKSYTIDKMKERIKEIADSL